EDRLAVARLRYRATAEEIDRARVDLPQELRGFYRQAGGMRLFEVIPSRNVGVTGERDEGNQIPAVRFNVAVEEQLVAVQNSLCLPPLELAHARGCDDLAKPRPLCRRNAARDNQGLRAACQRVGVHIGGIQPGHWQ